MSQIKIVTKCHRPVGRTPFTQAELSQMPAHYVKHAHPLRKERTGMRFQPEDLRTGGLAVIVRRCPEE